MNNIEVKRRFLEIEKQFKKGLESSAKRVIKEMNLTETVDDVLEVALKMSEHELSVFIDKHKLTCPKCGTAEHLVCAPVVFDTERNEYTKKFEIYCANTDPDSSVFSKCWFHVYGYQRGVQESVVRCSV